MLLCSIQLSLFHKFNFCSYNVHVHVHVVDYSVSAKNCENWTPQKFPLHILQAASFQPFFQVEEVREEGEAPPPPAREWPPQPHPLLLPLSLSRAHSPRR